MQISSKEKEPLGGMGVSDEWLCGAVFAECGKFLRVSFPIAADFLFIFNYWLRFLVGGVWDGKGCAEEVGCTVAMEYSCYVLVKMGGGFLLYGFAETSHKWLHCAVYKTFQ